jgi:RND family efflux transporter MFP subunit
MKTGRESKGEKMRIRTGWAWIVGSALAVAISGCGDAHDEKSAPEPAAISAATARSEATEIPKTIALYGTVEAERTAAVSSRVMGNVVAVRVKAGDSVKAGDVLVEIDPQTARGQESQARGALAQASAALALADRNYQRFQALAKSSAASELEVDMARMQYEQAKGAAEQGKGAVEAASSVARESRVVAPFAGRVTARLVEAGDFAAPGRPVAVIESFAGRRLVLSVPESAIPQAGLPRGMKLRVSLDALAGREISGTVSEMTPGADPMSHTFTLKVDLEGSDIATGLSGRAWLASGARKAVVIPRSAVVPQGGISMVVLKDANGKARSRAVTLGGDLDRGRVEVLAGLAGGETLLTGLLSAPPDGAPVNEGSK